MIPGIFDNCAEKDATPVAECGPLKKTWLNRGALCKAGDAESCTALKTECNAVVAAVKKAAAE